MNELREIWQDLADWHYVFYIAIPVFAWAIRKPVSNVLQRVLELFLKSIGLTVSDNLRESLLPALRVIIVAFGVLIANEQLAPPAPYFGLIEKVLISACVAAVFSVAMTMCVYIPDLLQRNRRPGIRKQSMLLLRLSKFLVLVVGVAAVLKVWGVDIGPALTGMGVLGAAVALAAQDSVKNLLGGLNNAAEQRFTEGDLIRVDGKVEGTVEAVDIRSTKIRRLDSAPVYVPNSELADSVVINFGRRRHRRIKWSVALTYGTPRPALRSIRDRIETYIDDCGLFVPAGMSERHVRISKLDDSSVDLLVYCFTRSTDYGDFLEASEALALAILEIVEEEGGHFAFPSRSIYVESDEKI